jgi:hypothetical protein
VPASCQRPSKPANASKLDEINRHGDAVHDALGEVGVPMNNAGTAPGRVIGATDEIREQETEKSLIQALCGMPAPRWRGTDCDPAGPSGSKMAGLAFPRMRPDRPIVARELSSTARKLLPIH